MGSDVLLVRAHEYDLYSNSADPIYRSLFLCSKFAITIPFLKNNTTNEVAGLRSNESNHLLAPENNTRPSTDNSQQKLTETHHLSKTSIRETAPMRNQAAAPPNHLIILAVFPVGIAVWICSTRYAEYYHFGFDIISGSLIGIVSAWFSFRWYHLPIRNGQGWAWGARNKHRAFGIGVGTANYGDEGVEWPRKRNDDIEMKAMNEV